MTGERWREIESIYHLALERPPHERAAFIAEACGSDPHLRSEVEDLVRRDESPRWSVTDSPVWAARNETGAPLAPGARLGPYEIVDTIGSGGMGVVFRAIDTRLGRSVAIKTSRGPFSDRFAREARTIASLNHPNICTLYDTGADYLIMELIEGPTLADRIRKGPLPLEEALGITRQIAAAIDAAHENGIIHRDLKPANIKIRHDGTVKVLDFGLAKVAVVAASARNSENSPTLTVNATQAGVILGTAAYMSPEQALGQEVDKRTDVWAFGVVLYEMLTGSQPFQGASVSDRIAEIVRKEPDLAKAPARVRRLLSLCLEKDPRKRLRSLGDWEHLVDPAEPPRKDSHEPKLRRIAWVAVAAILLAAAAVWLTSFRSATPVRTTRFQITLPENVYFDRSLTLSPDGQKLAFNATGEQNGLWIHNLDTLQWRRLPGTENAQSPFWSPDSRFLGFVIRSFSGTEVKKIDIAGGLPVTFYTNPDVQLGRGAWSRNGVIILGAFNPAGPLRMIPASGGTEKVITSLDQARGEGLHTLPVFLSDGKHFLYFIDGPAGTRGIYAGSTDVPPEAQPRDRILATNMAPMWADGKLLFLRDGDLMAQVYDPDRRRLIGEPVRLAEHVQALPPQPVVSISPGVLAYRSGPNLDTHRLTWLDRQGKQVAAVGEPNTDNEVRLSPDQARAAVDDSGGPEANIWILDFQRGMRTRLTFHPPAIDPVWSPDGSRIFFGSGPALEAISVTPANGGGEKELLREPGRFHYPASVSPDGRFLLYTVTTGKPQGPGVKGETWLLPVKTEGQPIHLLGSQFSENRAAFSPDGRWIAYRSNESGRFEVYIRSVQSSGPGGLTLGEGKWQASKAGVDITPPVWRRDSKELFYMGTGNTITAVKVDASRGSMPVDAPTPLFTAPCACNFDVSADGQRFLVRGAAVDGGKSPITVVLNWQAEFKGR